MLRWVQRDIHFLREFVWIEGAAGEIAALDFNRGDLAATVVDSKDEILGFGILVDVDLAKRDAALAEELLDAAAVDAETGAVDGDFSHWRD